MSETMRTPIPTKDAGPKPMCECHDVAMYWRSSRDYSAGGGWICAVVVRERSQRYRKTHLAKVAALAHQWRQANLDRYRAYNREYQGGWNALNTQRLSAGRRLRKYGMTADQYRDHVVGQAGRCLICLRVPNHDLHVDHDHATGKVRGLLCRDCNGVIGLARDSTVRLTSAIGYLQRSAT